MKLLFVTTDVGLYGSSKSLRLTIEAIRRHGGFSDDDLAVWFQLPLATRRYFFHPDFERVKHLRGVPLPCSSVHVGGSEGRLSRGILALRNVLSQLLWRTVFRRQIASGGYDVIVLNSLVLWPLLPLLPATARRVIIVRELVNHERVGTSRRAIRTIAGHADVVLAIDRATAGPFPNALVTGNPFMMTRARTIRREAYQQTCRALNLAPDAIKVVLVGRIEPLKGQERFLDAAERLVDDPRFVFVLVGEGSGPYRDRVVNRADALPNARRLGEVADMDQVYAVADQVVRCEDFLPLGRTFFEAYHAGCGMAIPCGPADDSGEVRDYLDDGVILYAAGDSAALARAIRDIAGRPATWVGRRPDGNERDFARRFMAAIGGYGRGIQA